MKFLNQKFFYNLMACSILSIMFACGTSHKTTPLKINAEATITDIKSQTSPAPTIEKTATETPTLTAIPNGEATATATVGSLSPSPTEAPPNTFSYSSGIQVGGWYSLFDDDKSAGPGTNIAPAEPNYSGFPRKYIDYMFPGNFAYNQVANKMDFSALEDTKGKATPNGDNILKWKASHSAAKAFARFENSTMLDIFKYSYTSTSKSRGTTPPSGQPPCQEGNSDTDLNVTIDHDAYNRFLNTFSNPNNLAIFFKYFDGIMIDFEPQCQFTDSSKTLISNFFATNLIPALQNTVNIKNNQKLVVLFYAPDSTVAAAANLISLIFDGYDLNGFINRTPNNNNFNKYWDKTEVLLYPTLLPTQNPTFFNPFDIVLPMRRTNTPVGKDVYKYYGIWFHQSVWPIYFQSLIFAAKFIDANAAPVGTVTSTLRSVVSQNNGAEIYTRKINLNKPQEKNPLIEMAYNFGQDYFKSGAVMRLSFSFPESVFTDDKGSKYQYEIWVRYKGVDFYPMKAEIPNIVQADGKSDGKGNLIFGDLTSTDPKIRDKYSVARIPCYPINYLDKNSSHINSIMVENGDSVLVPKQCNILSKDVLTEFLN